MDSEIVFQPLYPDTGAPLFDDGVIAEREESNFHIEFHQRDVTDGTRSPWKVPVDAVSESFHEVITIAEKIESTVQPLRTRTMMRCGRKHTELVREGGRGRVGGCSSRCQR